MFADCKTFATFDTMKTIDLEKIISEMGMSVHEVAQHLFPGNKAPIRGLKRILSGEAELSASQISKLSSLSGIPIGDLFGTWKMETDKDEYVLTFRTYTARICRNTWLVSLFDEDTLFHEDIILDKAIPMDELIESLNEQVKLYESA